MEKCVMMIWSSTWLKKKKPVKVITTFIFFYTAARRRRRRFLFGILYQHARFPGNRNLFRLH